MLKLDPTHVGAASIEALCAEASLPSVGDPSVAYEAYKRAVDMNPWYVSEALGFSRKIENIKAYLSVAMPLFPLSCTKDFPCFCIHLVPLKYCVRVFVVSPGCASSDFFLKISCLFLPGLLSCHATGRFAR